MLLWSRVFSLMSSKCQKCPSLIAVVFFVAAPNRICLAPCFFFRRLEKCRSGSMEVSKASYVFSQEHHSRLILWNIMGIR